MTNFNANNGLRNLLNGGTRNVGQLGSNARMRINAEGSPATSIASGGGVNIARQASNTSASVAGQSANATKEFNKSVEDSDDETSGNNTGTITKDNIDEKVAQAIKSDSQSQALANSRDRLLTLSATLQKDFDNLLKTAIAETKPGFSGTATFTEKAEAFNELLEQEGLSEFSIETDAGQFLTDESAALSGDGYDVAFGASQSQIDPILDKIGSQIVSIDLSAGTRASQLRSGFAAQIAAPAKELAAGNGNNGGVPSIGGGGIGLGPASPALGASLGASISNRAQFQRAGQFDQLNTLRQIPSLLKKV